MPGMVGTHEKEWWVLMVRYIPNRGATILLFERLFKSANTLYIIVLKATSDENIKAFWFICIFVMSFLSYQQRPNSIEKAFFAFKYKNGYGIVLCSSADIEGSMLLQRLPT
jgi:hypothetical protein